MITRNARFQISRLKRELAAAKKRIKVLNEASDFWLQQFINSQDKHKLSKQMTKVYQDGMHHFEGIIENFRWAVFSMERPLWVCACLISTL